MLAAARRRGFETVSTEARLAAYMGNHGIGDLRTSELVLHPRDPHPSARQHALIAQAILPIIERWIAGANGALAVGSSR